MPVGKTRPRSNSNTNTVLKAVTKAPEVKRIENVTFFDPLVCLQANSTVNYSGNVRESVRSSVSGSICRQRALALGILHFVSMRNKAHCPCLNHLKEASIDVWNTEATAAIHKVLRTLNLKSYITSEFVDPAAKSGNIIKGVRHEDLMEPSLPANSIDLIISAEVFEHIPMPYTAHRALFEVLRPGGAHVFTVPYEDKANDIIMSQMLPNGTIIHGPGQPPRFTSPQYHGDPLRKDGILVFTIFSRAMIRQLETIGYSVKVLNFQSDFYGVYTSNLVFIARKPFNK